MKYLKIENLKSKTYYDKDDIMFHACFQILKDFVEKELEIHDIDPKTYVMYDSETQSDLKETINKAINFYDKVLELYYWYEEWNKNGDLSYEDEELEQERLKELIDIRQYLWS